MDLPWGDSRSNTFVTNVGLITSDGPVGPNIMSCEWTHHVSYKPGLIAVCVGSHHATHENIAASKEFGVNIAASDQNILASIAGNNTGKEVNKIAALRERGIRFYPGKKVKLLMVEGAVMNAECRVVQEIVLGDHTMFVGEVLEAAVNAGKTPLILHGGKYWQFGERISKPPADELQRIERIIEKHRR